MISWSCLAVMGGCRGQENYKFWLWMVEGCQIPEQRGGSRRAARGRSPMLGVGAKITVKRGMGQQCEAVAKELVAKVNASEPGCRLYALHRGEAPQTYVF